MCAHRQPASTLPMRSIARPSSPVTSLPLTTSATPSNLLASAIALSSGTRPANVSCGWRRGRERGIRWGWAEAALGANQPPTCQHPSAPAPAQPGEKRHPALLSTRCCSCRAHAQRHGPAQPAHPRDAKPRACDVQAGDVGPQQQIPGGACAKVSKSLPGAGRARTGRMAGVRGARAGYGVCPWGAGASKSSGPASKA